MRLTKIYTKIGDKGSTALASGVMVPKNSARIEAYGTVDELNAFVGSLRDTLMADGQGLFKDLVAKLQNVQNELFDVGGELSTPLAVLNVAKQQVVTHECIARLEEEIDKFNETLPPLANFVLPGGAAANSQAHVARTVCRRAERLVVALAAQEPVRDEVRIYLNRLSDWFFVVSRAISQSLGVPEVLWNQRGKK